MIFSQLPQQQHFYFQDELYYKICPIYKTCCTVEYNTRGKEGYILLDETIEVTPQDSNVQPIPQPKPVFPVSNLFTAGDIMFLRYVPMNAKFIAGTEIYKKVGTDKAQKEDGTVIVMNKNTKVELLGDLDEEESTEVENFGRTVGFVTNKLNEKNEQDEDVDDPEEDEIYNGN